jgi:hypothetical protein
MSLSIIVENQTKSNIILCDFFYSHRKKLINNLFFLAHPNNRCWCGYFRFFGCGIARAVESGGECFSGSCTDNSLKNYTFTTPLLHRFSGESF